MRISDWSSDVCSSELCDDFFIAADECEIRDAAHVEKGDRARLADLLGKSGVIDGDKRRALSADGHIGLANVRDNVDAERIGNFFRVANLDRQSAIGPVQDSLTMIRSEEHTSELQSLMRISYAGFCLKKKNKQY